ncbi:hypothetical protein ACEPAI_9493 [Sanghuangporus weigelae]
MPRAAVGTPKYLANKMKSKGLQRLRWYCQVCQKQCRDENGFKCHSQSESHLRQMLAVGENASSHINSYSMEFQHDFVQLLSRRFGTKRVQANRVYQEFIQDKQHTHMNATRWVTLSEFVKHLGRSGICRVDETEKGWFIAWIDSSPKALAKQEASLKKERQAMGDEQRERMLITEQIERAEREKNEKVREGGSSSGAESGEDAKPAVEEGLKKDENEKVVLSISRKPSATSTSSPNPPPNTTSAPTATPAVSTGFKLNSLKAPAANPLKRPNVFKTAMSSNKDSEKTNGKKREAPMTAAERLILEEQERKRRRMERERESDRQLEPEPSSRMSSSEETQRVPIDNVHQDKRLSRLERIVPGERSKAKAAKTKTKKKKSSRGGIQKARKPASSTKPRILKAGSDGLLRLPLEVFSEESAADYLSILDLLSLSRLTRKVHNTMLSKNFRPIWRRAYEEAGAPGCPPDMNEVQFTSLVFDHFCQGCGSPRVRKVDYGLRVRLCSGCSSLNLIQGDKLVKTLPDMPKNDPTIFTLCYFQGAYKINDKERKNTPGALFASVTFFSPDFQDIVREYCSLPPDSEERKQFVQQRKEVVVNICKASRYNSSTRSLIADFLCSARSRYPTMAWIIGSDLFFSVRVYNSFIVPLPLFPVLAWKNIWPRLNKILAERRQQEEDGKRAYLWLDVQSHYLRFCKTWEAEHGERPLMVLADLQEQGSEARTLVASTKIGDSITGEQWKSQIECLLPDKIRAFERRYRFEMAFSLITARRWAGLPRLFSTQPGGRTDMDVLAHATSFIAPVHRRRIGYEPISTFVEFEAARRQLTAQESAFKSISLQHDVIEIASFLLRALGFPERTTMPEMEKLGLSFVCKRCDRKPVVAMSWKELVIHFEAETRQYRRLEYLLRENPRVEMTLIDSHNIDESIPLAERIKSEEEGGPERTTRRILEKGPARLCPICTNAFPGQRWFAWAHPDCIAAHLRSTHGVVEAVEDYMRVLMRSDG